MNAPDDFALSFLQRHPADAARVLEGVDGEQLVGVLGATDAAIAGAVAAQLSAPAGGALLRGLEPDHAAAILATLAPGAGARLLRALGRAAQEPVLAALEPAVRAGLERLLRYPEGTVGRVMETQVLTFQETMDVEQAQGATRRDRDPTLALVFVLDQETRPTGLVSVRDLLLAEPDRPVGTLMRPCPRILGAGAALHPLREGAAWAGLELLPVVDGDGRFAGTLSRSAALEWLVHARGAGETGGTLGSTIMALADLFWGTASELVVGAATSPKERAGGGGDVRGRDH